MSAVIGPYPRSSAGASSAPSRVDAATITWRCGRRRCWTGIGTPPGPTPLSNTAPTRSTRASARRASIPRGSPAAHAAATASSPVITRIAPSAGRNAWIQAIESGAGTIRTVRSARAWSCRTVAASGFRASSARRSAIRSCGTVRSPARSSTAPTTSTASTGSRCSVSRTNASAFRTSMAPAARASATFGRRPRPSAKSSLFSPAHRDTLRVAATSSPTKSRREPARAAISPMTRAWPAATHAATISTRAASSASGTSTPASSAARSGPGAHRSRLAANGCRAAHSHGSGTTAAERAEAAQSRSGWAAISNICIGYLLESSRFGVWTSGFRWWGWTTRARISSWWRGSPPRRTAWSTWRGCAGRAHESARPAQPRQVLQAVLLGGEPRHQLLMRARVVHPHHRNPLVHTPNLLDSSRYPIHLFQRPTASGWMTMSGGFGGGGGVVAEAMQLEEDLARWRDATAVLIAHAPADLDGPGAARVHRQVRTACGRALDGPLPEATSAVQAGRMTLEQAAVLARFAPTSDARRAALASELPDRNEAALVAKAQRMGVDEYRRVVKRWAAAVDSDAQEREHQAACAAERLVFARRDNGVAFEGFLTVEHGDVLMTALRSVTGVPAKDDTRSADERRAAALTDLARLVLDKGMSSGGVQVRPHVSVHVSWETYQRLAERSGTGEVSHGVRGPLAGPAELDDGEPIAPSVLARIACDSQVTRIVFGPDSRPLDVGRAQRTFTGPQRHAVIGRDRTCRYPGCGAVPMLGEVHHVRWWGRDSAPTSVGNGILLCWYHHDLVHQRNLAIRWEPGGWTFWRVDGSACLLYTSPSPRD